MKSRIALVGLILVCLGVHADNAPAASGKDLYLQITGLIRAVITRYAASQAPAVPAVKVTRIQAAAVQGSSPAGGPVLEADTENIETLVDTIRRTAQVNIVLDSNAIREGAAAGTVRTNITLKVDNMTLRSALNWICRLSGLRWVLKDEAIFISTADRIEGQEQVLRIYDIRDLSSTIEDFPGPQIELVPGEADISISN